jgi:hypothetical protein
MSIPSNGITADVIRDIMPPYHLSTDLLAGAFRALPPPPPDATAASRHARIARLVQEIGGLMPADAPQARIAAQIVVVREVTDDTFSLSHAPGLTVEQVCRLRRTAAGLTRSAATLERTLARRQAKPAPFFGTTLAEGVDLAALDAVWSEGGLGCDRAGAGQCQDEDAPGGRVDPTDWPVPAGMMGLIPGSGSGTAMTIKEDCDCGAEPDRRCGDGRAATQGESGDSPAATDRGSVGGAASAEGGSGDRPAVAGGDRVRSPAVAIGPLAPDGLGRNAGSAAAWVATRLDQGPDWTLEVVRPRRVGEAGVGAAPGSAA